MYSVCVAMLNIQKDMMDANEVMKKMMILWRLSSLRTGCVGSE